MSANDRLAMFENMAAADPENELAHFSVGKLRFEAGRVEDSIVALRRTLEINPQHTQAHRFLGEALLATGHRDEAIDVLRRGVELGHARGEYLPRNAMIEILVREGETPPELAGAASEADDDPGAFTCRRCLRRGRALARPPFTTELGRRIQETICEACWKEWMAMSIKVINELRLNPATPEGSRVWDQHMCEFLGLPALG